MLRKLRPLRGVCAVIRLPALCRRRQFDAGRFRRRRRRFVPAGSDRGPARPAATQRQQRGGAGVDGAGRGFGRRKRRSLPDPLLHGPIRPQRSGVRHSGPRIAHARARTRRNPTM